MALPHEDNTMTNIKRALIAAGMFLLAYTPAIAEPPPAGDYGGGRERAVIVCDTREQVVSIVRAGDENPLSGARTRYNQLAMMPNGAGERLCGVISIGNGPISFGVREDLGKFYLEEGEIRHAWTVFIRIPAAPQGYWLLWLDPWVEVPIEPSRVPGSDPVEWQFILAI